MQKFGKYEIKRQIGEGGFGRVFEAYDPAIKRRVAIKTCSAAIPEVRSRFLREASIAGNLQHRNITVVFDLGEEGGVPYLVQEYLGGEDLSVLLARQEDIPLATKLSYLTQTARGLGYAHSQGVIHRDIKPSNIRVQEAGVIKIMDFGIAKTNRGDTSLTNTGETVGTSTYLSPEQIRADPLDARCDIYAFGVLAYELATGTPLVKPGSPQKVIYAILNGSVPDLSSFPADLPPRLAATIRRCLQKDPKLRYANCGELLMDLNQLALPSTHMSHSVSGPTVEYRDVPPGVREGYPPGQFIHDEASERPTSELDTDQVPIPAATSPPHKPIVDDSSTRDFDTADVPAPISGSQSKSVPADVDLNKHTESGGGVLRMVSIAVILLLVLAGAFFGARLLRPTGPVAAPTSTILPSTTAASEAAGQRRSPLPPAQTGGTDSPVAAIGSRTTEPHATLVLRPGWDPSIRVSIDGDNALDLDNEQALALPVGRHFLEFSILRDDYQAFESIEIELLDGQRHVIEPPLPQPGRLTVRSASSSPQLFVRIDGQPMGYTPIQGRLLPPGQHEMLLTKTGESRDGRKLTVEVGSARETVLVGSLDLRTEISVYQRAEQP